jgi:hypothetical protein
MKKTLIALAIAGAFWPIASALAESDWPEVDAALGRKAVVFGTIHKYGFPRSDLHVKLDNVDIKPGLALGGWLAFEPAGHAAMMMGDLVLTDTEINPVMRTLLANGVQVTGVHNHLLRSSPATYYMHVGAKGDPVKLAGVVREALAQTKTPLQQSAAPPAESAQLDFDAAQVEEALVAKGKNNSGVLQFSFPKAEQIRASGMTVAPAMGTAIAINFQPTGAGKAAISGDFVATAAEVEPVLNALQKGGIEVTALHNHMLDDEPRLFFVHFWADDDAVKLARSLRTALDAAHAVAKS